MPGDNADQEIIVTAADDCPDIETLAQRLAARGLGNPSVLSGIGLITGHGRPDLIEALRGEPGVKGVELGGDVQLPSPDSPVQ